MTESEARELNFKKWPGNEFDFNDKELFQTHEQLCDDLETQKYPESDIVKISVGIWAGLRFAQIARHENGQLQAELKEKGGEILRLQYVNFNRNSEIKDLQAELDRHKKLLRECDDIFEHICNPDPACSKCSGRYPGVTADSHVRGLAEDMLDKLREGKK